MIIVNIIEMMWKLAWHEKNEHKIKNALSW
jgi:hypothetical protein